MKNLIKILLEERTAPRDGDRVTLNWSTLNPTIAQGKLAARRINFRHIEMLVYALTLLVIVPALAFSAELPVLKSDVRRGEIITESNITFKTIEDNIRLNPRTVEVADDLFDMEATRTIRANRPIMSDYIRIPPTVRKGDSVILHYNTGGIHLTGQARALEDALMGDMVKLVNIDSNKQLVGRVVAPSTVEVQ